MLEPRSASRHPELISDGSGLPFAPAALIGAAGELDTDDAAVGVLVATIARQAKTNSARRSWLPWKRESAPPKPAASPPSARRLAGGGAHRRRGPVRARAASQARHGGRAPGVKAPRVDVHRGQLGTARCARSRDGIRASGWRLDPTHEADPAQRELRVLVTEQTWAGGQPGRRPPARARPSRRRGRVGPDDVRDSATGIPDQGAEPRDSRRGSRFPVPWGATDHRRRALREVAHPAVSSTTRRLGSMSDDSPSGSLPARADKAL